MEQSGQWNSREVETVFVTFMSFFMNVAVRFFIPSILPLLIVLQGLSKFMAGLLITSYWIGYALIQLPAGIIADKIGSGNLAKISFLGFSAVFSLLYFTLHSFMAMSAIQFALGIFSGMIYISDASLIQRQVHYSRRTTGIGLYQAGFFVASTVGFVLVISLVRIDLYLPFILYSAMLFAVSILNLVFIRTTKEPVRRERILLRLGRKLVLTGIIRFAASISFIGFAGWIAVFLVDSGVPYYETFYYSWFLFVGGIVGSPLSGVITDRFAKRKFEIAFTGSLFIGISLVALTFLQNIIFMIPAFISMGFLYGFYAAPSISIASDVSHDNREVGSSTGFLNLTSQVGATISPFLIGLISEITGNLRLSFEVVGFISILSLMITLPFYRREKETV